MPRIAGVNIPNDKRIVIALTSVYGIGLTTSKKILKNLSLDEDTRTKDIKEEDINKLRVVIEKENKVEGALKRDRLANIKRLKEIKSYRGSRHSKGLPLHGQNTKTNSRTTRGNVRRTLGSGRIKSQKT
jgi:small subunit ribosomal protein S13